MRRGSPRYQSYDAARIRGLVTSRMRQAPPLREQARGLRIAPLTQRILDRMDARREHERERIETRFDNQREQLDERTRELPGDAPDSPGRVAPCTSVAATTRQWEELQRFRLFTELEEDALERRFAVIHIRHLLRQNVEQLRMIATQPDACPAPVPTRTFTVGSTTFEVPTLPPRETVVAAIVTDELARAALGSTRSGAYLSAPSETLTEGQARDLAALRMRLSLTLEPVPNGVLLFRPEIGRVLDHLRTTLTPTR